MKKAVIYSVLVLGCWWITGCKKETSIENDGVLVANFTAQINGLSWAASLNHEQVALFDGVISILGVDASDRQIAIILDDTVVGTYTLNQQSVSVGEYANIDSSNLYGFSTNQGKDSVQAGGTVTVTAIDKVKKTITGTFSFRVYRDVDSSQKSLTQGKFTKLSYGANLPSSQPADTLTVAIDGGDWAAQYVAAVPLNGQLNIAASSSDGSQMVTLIVPDNSVPGTYSLDGTQPAYVGGYDLITSGVPDASVSNSGTVTILSNNSAAFRMRGTFSFQTTGGTSSSGHNLTGGFFSVYYGP